MRNGDKWIEIVSPQEKEEAKAAFEKWKTNHPELVRNLQDNNIRIDTILSDIIFGNFGEFRGHLT